VQVFDTDVRSAVHPRKEQLDHLERLYLQR